MVLKINNLGGFETQGAEEASSTSGTPTYPMLSQRSGNVNLLLDVSAESYGAPWVSRGVTDAGTDYVITFLIRYGSTTQDATAHVEVKDSAGTTILSITMGASAKLEVRDVAGSVAITATNAVGTTGWHLVQIYFEHVDSGAAELFIDGTSEGTAATTDFSAGNSLNASAELVWTHDGSNQIEIDCFSIQSGATASSDRLSNIEVYMKQGAQTGTTPDTSVLDDTILDEGTWEGASETPLDEETQDAAASYTGTVVAEGVVYADGSGDKLGPNGDDRFTGVTIKAMKGIWRMARSGGGGTAQFGEIGNDGGAASDIETTADLDLTTVYVNYEFLTETAATLPSLTEHAAIGFSKDGGGQDLDVAEMWAMILVAPNAPNVTDLADAEWPDQNYHVGPFEI